MDQNDKAEKLGFGRIRDRKDYLSVAETRRKWITKAFILQARTSEDDTFPKVGFTVSKKVGNAVQRNRAKRRLKEVVRFTMPNTGQKGWSYVVIGRQAAIDYPFIKLQKDLKWALAKLDAGADLKSSEVANDRIT